MLTLTDRAAQALSRLPVPALPLDQLVQLLRQSGAVATPDVLRRALEGRPDLFRILDPWRGPWRRSGSGVRSRWIVARTRERMSPGTEDRLLSSLTQLAATVDEGSVADLTRWLGMIRESERLAALDLRRSA